MTFRPWRISAWYFKLLFIAVGYALGLGIDRTIGLLRPGHIAMGVVVLVTHAALLWLGARVFRGSNENYLAPRAWWRMTSKPTLSRRLGILWTVCGSIGLLGTVAEPFLPRLHAAVLPDLIFSTIQYAALAYLYLNSAARQMRQLRQQALDPTAVDAQLG